MDVDKVQTSDDPDVDARRAADAEAVRAGLVRLRGGAPFLSPGDATALVGWLDAGVGVGRILAAVEQAAAKRHARRVRAPLRLVHAAPFLAGSPRAPAAVAWVLAEPTASADAHPLAPVARALAGTALDPLLRPLADALVDELRALPVDDDLHAEAAGRVVAFLDAAWEALGPGGRDRYVARAAARLADLLDDLDDTLRDALLEEHARGILRDELPCLSLTTLLTLVGA